MSLSKKSRRNIARFNQARNQKYSGIYVPLTNQIDLFVKAYKELKSDSTVDSSRQVAGTEIP